MTGDKQNKDLVWKDLLKVGESSRLPLMTVVCTHHTSPATLHHMNGRYTCK
jgi:hypothetical protein